MALDLRKDLVVHWPAATAAVAPLLSQLGARALLTESAAPGLAEGCGAARIALVADIRTPQDLDSLAGSLSAARRAGFGGAAVPAVGKQETFRAFVREHSAFLPVVFLSAEQADWDVQPAQAVLRHGVWPGIATGDVGGAGATESVWLDANTSLVAQLRAMRPERPAVLGYRPDKDGGVPETRSVPPRSAEVALADAFSAGGSLVLSIPDLYREALLNQQPQALEAWKSLAGVHAFIGATSALAATPLTGRTAVLCGSIEETGEILNLAFRKNLCPVAMRASSPPPLEPSKFDVAVAANVEVAPPVSAALARFAERGGAVLAAPAGDEKSPWWTTRGWKKIRTEDDRDVYAAGKGLVYGYHSLILDPGAFALDIKEIAGERSQPEGGLKNLDLRIWGADTVLGVLHSLSPASIAAVLTAYGNPPRHDFLVSIRGRYRRASIRQVSAAEPQPVPIMARAGRVEINLKQLSRVAVLTLEE